MEHACFGTGGAGCCHRIGGRPRDVVGGGQQGMQRGAGRYGCAPVRGLGQQEGAHHHICGLSQRTLCGSLHECQPAGLLDTDLLRRVGGHVFDGTHGLQAGRVVHTQQHLLALQVFGQLLEGDGIGFGQCLAHFPVITAQGLESVFGNAPGQSIQIGQAQQGVAHLQVVIQKVQRAPFFKSFQPQCHAGQLDGHGVAVHAIDAVCHDLTQGVTVVLRPDGPLVPAGHTAQQRQPFRQTPGSGQQKVPTATGRVDDADGQQGCFRCCGAGSKPLLDDGFECTADQFLHQTVGGVVAAGQFAGITCRTGCVGSAHEVE